MKQLLLLALLLGGCAAVPKDVRGPVSGVKAAVESAAWATRNAKQHTAAAKVSLQLATAKTRELLTIASPAERPLAMQLESSLAETQTELNGVQEQLRAADGALADSSGEVDVLQKRMSATEKELVTARNEANRSSASRDFWRACTWKLALLALALGVWTFRRPLLAMCGAPIL